MRNSRWPVISVMLVGLAVTIFTAVLYAVFPPFWETNDDVGMEMVAHGYGMAAHGGPTLIFSNAVWGYIVRSIPKIGTAYGYSIATILVLIATSVSGLVVTRRLGVPWLYGCTITILLWLRPLLFPQFTLNAGLLVLASVAWLQLYERQPRGRYLIAAVAFAYLSFLIRDQEFFLALAIATPLIPWRRLLRARQAWMAMAAFGVIVGCSVVINKQAYQGQAWKDFWAFNFVYKPLTDFGAIPRVLARPDVLAEYHVSANDVMLVATWFLVEDMVKPDVISGVIEKAGSGPSQSLSLAQGWNAIAAINDAKLYFLIVAGLILLYRYPSRRALVSWALVLAAIFAMGVVGRPGILRVYYPLFCVLVFAPLLTAGARPISKVVSAVLLLALTANSVIVLRESRAARQQSVEARADLSRYPSETIVAWGVFPYERAYPVLGVSDEEYRRRILALGGFTPAPFSVAYVDSTAGHGLIARLLSPKGVPIIGAVEPLLKVYCAEHYRGVLQKEPYAEGTKLFVARYRCASPLNGASAGVESINNLSPSSWQDL